MSLLAASVLILSGLAGYRFGLPKYYVHRAQRALELRNAEAAQAWLQSAVRVAPDNAEIHFWKARAARHLNRYEQVMESLSTAKRLGFPEDRIRREKWLMLAQAGQLNKVERHLPGLLTDPGEDARDICEAFVKGYAANVQFDSAFRLIEVWKGDFPEDAEPYFWHGYLLESINKNSQALEEYRQGLEMAPDQTRWRLRLAAVLLLLHRFEKAEAEFRRCVEERPDNPEAWAELANCLAAQRKTEEAQACYQRALEFDPQHLSARKGLAELAFDNGRPEEALQWLKPLIDAGHKGPTLLYLFARACEATGDHERAETLFDFLEEAEAQLERLEELVDTVVSRPHDAGLRYEIGMILMRYRSESEGVRWLRAALQVDPHHRKTHAALAEYYAEQGDRKRAGRHRRLAGNSSRAEP